jgi:hypothetical protein
VGLLVLLASTPAYAIRVGWNVDIHQGKFGGPNNPENPNDYANDFHIWGVLESGVGDNNPPTYLGQVNFETNGPFVIPPWMIKPDGLRLGWDGSRITDDPDSLVDPPARPLPAGAPPISLGGPFYYFDANWSTEGQIPYCTWMHFGVEFDETCHNIGYWLQGVWTKDGEDPVGNPIYGFDVQDGWPNTPAPGTQKIRIQNASRVETMPHQMDLMILTKEEGAAFQLADLNTDYFREHESEYANRWKSATSLLPTEPMNGIDSFFDVYLDDVPELGMLGPEQVLLARQYSEYTGGSQDFFWQYELHAAHTPEPGTLVLLGTGALGLLAYAWRRRRS